MSTEGEKVSKNALKKAEKKAEKAAKKTEHKAATSTPAAAAPEADQSELFGILPLHQSGPTDRKGRKFALLSQLGDAQPDEEVFVRARVSKSRATGNLCFLELRQAGATCQAVVAKTDTVPKALVVFASKVSNESIVEVSGKVVRVAQPVVSVTVQNVELHVQKLHVFSGADANLPIILADASTPEPLLEEQEKEVARIAKKLEKFQLGADGKAATPEAQKQVDEIQAEIEKAKKYRVVEIETRLNHRCIDMRTSANQAVFRLQSAIGQLFREFLVNNQFIEIHTPKLIGAKSEGGANVFTVSYFDNYGLPSAYLAQSPQFYKQMAVCADFARVFEIGPVFRAEKSFTPRHMTEFVGLDLEMEFQEHYHEVVDFIDRLFEYMFTGLLTRFRGDINIVSQQYPFEEPTFKFPSPLISFQEGVRLLKERGVDHNVFEDLDTPKEKLLGQIIKEKYGSDFYRLDQFPTGTPGNWVRPFYTMLNATDPNFTNSYDFMLRGQEILSGAQRVHDCSVLEQRAKLHQIDLDTIRGYVEAFRYGAPPHAGCGIGLERVVMLFLGLPSIRHTSMFPRTPKRLFP